MEVKAVSGADIFESFELLRPIWPEMHALALEAEQNADKLPDFATIRLRSLSEAMVCHLVRHHDLSLISDETHFERLQLLERENLLNRRVLGLLHTIRKLGNIAAHNKRPVSPDEAQNLVEDARSLADWFCRYMRPDIDWSAQRPPPLDESATSREPQYGGHPVTPSETKAHARGDGMSVKASPQVRPPQTRISLRDIFEEDLTTDQQRCISALDGFLSDDNQRVFLLKGYWGFRRSRTPFPILSRTRVPI